MKHYLAPLFVLAAYAILTSISVQAENREEIFIALSTDDFVLAETDISTLAIGDAQTLETDDGKVIDILRTADGVEIYVDGELHETDLMDDGLHEEHMLKKHVEIICDSDHACDENVIIHMGDNSEALEWVTADGENIVIHREVEMICSDDEDGTRCSEQTIRVSGDEEIDIEMLLDEHKKDADHKIIVIRKEIVTED